MAAKALVVGLGNPGREYAANRHNVGFQCLDRLAAHHGLAFGRMQSGALVASGIIAGRSVVLAKPQSFMNLSGRPAAALVRFFQIELCDLLVVYDEMDLPLGTLRLREEGGAGGHNGMASLIQHLATQNFPRLRVGISRPPGRMDPAAYVLQDFSREEHLLLSDVYSRAGEAVETWLKDGIEKAMNLFNRAAS